MRLTERKERIAKYFDQREVEAFLRYITWRTTIVKVKSKFKVVREDPADDVVLNMAYSGKTSYIVSGDKHLLA
jgi:putative PIN family toxin of toxin-antitoxin system